MVLRALCSTLIANCSPRFYPFWKHHKLTRYLSYYDKWGLWHPRYFLSTIPGLVLHSWLAGLHSYKPLWQVGGQNSYVFQDVDNIAAQIWQLEDCQSLADHLWYLQFCTRGLNQLICACCSNVTRHLRCEWYSLQQNRESDILKGLKDWFFQMGQENNVFKQRHSVNNVFLAFILCLLTGRSNQYNPH